MTPGLLTFGKTVAKSVARGFVWTMLLLISGTLFSWLLFLLLLGSLRDHCQGAGLGSCGALLGSGALFLLGLPVLFYFVAQQYGVAKVARSLFDNHSDVLSHLIAQELARGLEEELRSGKTELQAEAMLPAVQNVLKQLERMPGFVRRAVGYLIQQSGGPLQLSTIIYEEVRQPGSDRQMLVQRLSNRLHNYLHESVVPQPSLIPFWVVFGLTIVSFVAIMVLI